MKKIKIVFIDIDNLKKVSKTSLGLHLSASFTFIRYVTSLAM